MPTAGSQVLARPTRSQIRYTGIIVIAPGSIIVARTRPKSRLRNRWEAANPKAARALAIAPIAAANVTVVLLTSHRSIGLVPDRQIVLERPLLGQSRLSKTSERASRDARTSHERVQEDHRGNEQRDDTAAPW